MPDFQHVEKILADATGHICPAAQIVVWWQGDIVYSHQAGYIDPETRLRPVQPDTLFDLASVTKLFAVTTFMTLVEAGLVSLDAPVSAVFPEFSGERPIQPYEDPLDPGAMVHVSSGQATQDASLVTFRHLLSHTSGLPAWRPLYQQEDARAALQMAIQTFFSYPAGEQVVYSDIGLILLSQAIERLTGMNLLEAVSDRVLQPLQLQNTRFLPLSTPLTAAEREIVAPTEQCTWRRRRIQGEVHDENAWRLGGISGHAGLFSTAADVARFGQVFLDRGNPLLQPETVDEMTRLQAQTGNVRRGLGFVLWSPDPEASGNPFSQSAFGHTGFTGTSVWIDPQNSLVVALLTNDVYSGRVGRGIAPLRVAIHQAVIAAIQQL